MATGIPIGLALGWAVGMESGKRKAREDLRQFMAERGIEMRDAGGRVVAFEEALGHMDLSGEVRVNLRWALLVVSALVLVGLAAFYIIKV